MSRIVGHPSLSVFRDRLADLGVDSVVTDPASVADELEGRIDRPAVAWIDDDVPLPTGVDADPDREALERAETGITTARLGVASHGSVVVSQTGGLEGPVSLFPSKHVAIVRAADVVPDLATAFEILEEEFERGADDAVFVTGPSSTGDMGEMVVGVHGPGAMEIVIVE
ncbi:LUD domain-containing protein [Halovivax sp.]|uniref:LUD domain-containing protein n=1 Tax=Halovivax sp. TaxID=1935978 RepID=UPI0025BE06AA|nr:LUD domain-containing protein [Halovivax sp.]